MKTILIAAALLSTPFAFANGLSNSPVCTGLASDVAKSLAKFAVEPGLPVKLAQKVEIIEETMDTATYKVVLQTEVPASETIVYDVTLDIDSNSCVLDTVKFVSVQ